MCHHAVRLASLGRVLDHDGLWVAWQQASAGIADFYFVVAGPEVDARAALAVEDHRIRIGNCSVHKPKRKRDWLA